METNVQLSDEVISQIYFIRGQKVMIDSDLARIYGVKTRILNQAVKRNRDRFPDDFMFQLSSGEFVNLMSQVVISSSQMLDTREETELNSQFVGSGWGGKRKPPNVFTEHGALMLAGVLNSTTAVLASIYVVRAFVKLSEILSLHKDLMNRINALEKQTLEKLDEHSEQLKVVFQVLKELIQKNDEPRNPMGYKIGANDR